MSDKPTRSPKTHYMCEYCDRLIMDARTMYWYVGCDLGPIKHGWYCDDCMGSDHSKEFIAKLVRLDRWLDG